MARVSQGRGGIFFFFFLGGGGGGGGGCGRQDSGALAGRRHNRVGVWRWGGLNPLSGQSVELVGTAMAY
eukprot:SAG11_NODE_1618_length_4571_cov_11.714733_5_plen_69_part_00